MLLLRIPSDPLAYLLPETMLQTRNGATTNVINLRKTSAGKNRYIISRGCSFGCWYAGTNTRRHTPSTTPAATPSSSSTTIRLSRQQVRQVPVTSRQHGVSLERLQQLQFRCLSSNLTQHILSSIKRTH